MKLAIALLALATATPAIASNTTTMQHAATPGRTLTAIHRDVPIQIPLAERAQWKAMFASLRAGRYTDAAATLARLPDSPLKPYAQAELLLLRGAAPGVADAAAFLAANPNLPQAPRLATKLGLAASTPLPPVTLLYPVGEHALSPRLRARGDALSAALSPLVTAERAADAEAVWTHLNHGVAPDLAAEWAQKIAWSYYRAGDDAGARRLGTVAANSAGEHGAMGAWIAGLAAWRADDCASAASLFDAVTAKNPGDDLKAASAYWASRAHLACERPDLATQRLQIAGAYAQSFYGLLARRALGLASGLDWSEPDFIKADWNHLSSHPGARIAVALVEVGQLGLADRELRYLATTAEPTDYAAILRLAARLSLPATQLWLSGRSPTGTATALSAKFPAPDWTPPRGWRVDQALVYAHALQESRFATDVVSRAGARGVMQMMPATASQVSRETGIGGELRDPAFNIECGQTYLEELRDTSYTAGLLPKVIAAYNAGPGSVQKWNASVRDNGDPLLFIESIPFKETRAYVEIVLRNYWMYELRDGRAPTSIDALAAGLWPKFPGMPGALAVRMERSGTVMAARP